MGRQAIVLMLKGEGGALTEELGSYDVAAHGELITQAYAVQGAGGTRVRLALSTGRDVEDWEYDAICDYYDTEIYEGLAEIGEIEGAYNPTWEFYMPFNEDAAVMEDAINQVVGFHAAELASVLEAIAEHKDEYLIENQDGSERDGDR